MGDGRPNSKGLDRDGRYGSSIRLGVSVRAGSVGRVGSGVRLPHWSSMQIYGSAWPRARNLAMAAGRRKDVRSLR